MPKLEIAHSKDENIISYVGVGYDTESMAKAGFEFFNSTYQTPRWPTCTINQHWRYLNEKSKRKCYVAGIHCMFKDELYMTESESLVSTVDAVSKAYEAMFDKVTFNQKD